MKIHIKNGRLIDPKNKIDAAQDVFIAAGKVVGIGTPPADFHANRTLDATGLIVCPGLIDLSARLREPGLEYKATLESELHAAIAGGVTSLACPPDTDPPLDEPGLVEMLKHRAKNLNLAHIYPVGALTQGLDGLLLTEMLELRDAGCVAFGQTNTLPTNLKVLMQAMRYAATFDISVWLYPQELSLFNDGVAHDGEVATRLGLPAIPACAETIAVSNIMILARETGARVHLCRLSCAESVNMIRAAKREGLPVSCDVSINHLHLSEMDIGFFDSHCHLTPPLRSSADRDVLRMGLMDGTIDAICSDHSPTDEDAKLLPFGQSDIGATGLELLLPLTMKWGVEMRQSPEDILSKITQQPAQILNIDAGHLSVDATADLCIFDPDQYWTVTPDNIKSQGKNTPFLGLELPATIRYTLAQGHIVYEHV